MEKLDISVIVLTFNEEKNLANCLESVAGWVKEIFVVDSFSSDNTLEIAKRFGARTYQHEFKNQAQQLNWALKELPIKTKWILRLDADEKILPELKQGIEEAVKQENKNITGYFLKRRVYFMGKWIKHGGFYPTLILRLWQNGKGFSEPRLMDEHIVLTEGRAEYIKKGDFVDDNKKNLSFWISKHNNYAYREAVEALNLKYHFLERPEKENFGSQEAFEARKRKEKFYLERKIFLRSFLYFFYRYFFRLGFLDGKEGLVFHFLQGLWYRFLVDAKIYEIEKQIEPNMDKQEILRIIENYGRKQL